MHLYIYMRACVWVCVCVGVCGCKRMNNVMERYRGVEKETMVLKMGGETGWGKQKETLMATYKSVIRPALVYVSSVYPMPLPYGRLLHPRPALTDCKSCRTQH